MHANGGIMNGVLHASEQNGACLCIFARFFFFSVSVLFFLPKMARKKSANWRPF